MHRENAVPIIRYAIISRIIFYCYDNMYVDILKTINEIIQATAVV